MLQIRLLGQFDLRVEGKRVVIPSRAGQSLLAYLLLTAGTAHRREKLAGLFWPDTSDENARRNLRQELWRVRKALANPTPSNADYLLSEELSITFNPNADYWLDVAQLERATAAQESSTELASRLGNYRGELLPGFYDDWVVLERERLQGLFETRMQQLMELLIHEQRWATVLEWGERWIALGATPEPAYRALMLAYARLGDRAQVAATFERCAAALEKELGVEPAPETRTLYEQLARGEPADGVNLTLTQVAPTHARAVDEPPAPGAPPFKGLRYFDESDADLFFGRELLTAKLVSHLRASHFLAVVVGASGSGKSSIVRAGLIPALKRGERLADGTLPPKGSANWDLRVMTPTAHPLEALAIALTRESESVTTTATLMDDLARDPRSLGLYVRKRLSADGRPPREDQRLLLVVDQFEELFTLCREEFEREAFIDNMLTAVVPSSAALTGGGSVTLILTIRADFYAHLAQYPELRDAVAKEQEYIGPMSADELRRAIEEPARRGGWEFEPGLADLMLRDVGNEPGALPLLSHALLETWHRRSGRRMTLKGYAESGGVRGAIAQTAETIYQELSPEQQAIARNIFLRLTELGEGTEDTRRRAALSELVPPSGDGRPAQKVIQLLADARLVTTGEGTVEVAHEALIREWARLREWLNEDREGLRLHRQVTEAAHDWELLDRDPGALYRGVRLGQALEWEAANPQALNAQERAFLVASKEWAEREAAESEAQRERELRAAQELAEERSRAAKQLQQRAYFLAGAFVLAIVLAGIALFFGERARVSAVAAQANAHIATARELAASAIANFDVDAERSVLLALQAVEATRKVDGTVLPEAEDALHRAVIASRLRLTLRGHEDKVVRVAFSADGTRMATSDPKGTRIWDAATGKLLYMLPGLFMLNSWQDPDRFATVEWDDNKMALHLWNANTGIELSSTSFEKSADQFVGSGGRVSAAISPDLTRLAVGYKDGTLEIRDAASGQPLLNPVGPTGLALWDIVFSRDGKWIAASISSLQDRTVKVWDVFTGKEILSLPIKGLGVARFTPDGTRLVTGDNFNVARVWEISSGKELLNLYGHTNGVGDIAFSPDGTRIATASSDRTAKVWDATTGRQLFTLSGHENFLSAIAFSPDGQRIITGSGDKTAKVWDATPSSEVFSVDTGGRLTRGSMNPAGTRLVTGGHAVQVWDISHAFDAETPGAKLLMTLRNVRGNIDPEFSPDGNIIATGTFSNTGIVWNAETGKQIFTMPIGEALEADIVAYSPDGARVALSSAEPKSCCVRVWDTKDGKLLLKIDSGKTTMTGITFTPDGKQLVIGNDDGTISIRDASSGNLLYTFTAHADYMWDVRYSPDGKRVISSSEDGTAKVWDATTWKEMFTLPHTSTVDRSEYSRDGTRIVTASDDGTAKIWDAATGKELLTLYGATSGVEGAVFSPDGTRVITTSEDGAIRVYLVRIEDLVALAKTRVTRALTADECQEFLHMEQCPPTP